jgi:hypothetical protein
MSKEGVFAFATFKIKPVAMLFFHLIITFDVWVKQRVDVRDLLSIPL